MRFSGSARGVTRRIVRRRLMFVRMMPKMPRGYAILMRAVRSYRCPRRLQRQGNQHENEKQTFHCPRIISGGGGNARRGRRERAQPTRQRAMWRAPRGERRGQNAVASVVAKAACPLGNEKGSSGTAATVTISGRCGTTRHLLRPSCIVFQSASARIVKTWRTQADGRASICRPRRELGRASLHKSSCRWSSGIRNAAAEVR